MPLITGEKLQDKITRACNPYTRTKKSMTSNYTRATTYKQTMHPYNVNTIYFIIFISKQSNVILRRLIRFKTNTS